MSYACTICQSSTTSLVTNTLRRGHGSIYRCDSCDYEFLISESTRNDQSFYETSYWQSVGPSLEKESSYQDIYEAYVEYQNNRINTILPYLSNQSSVIEIGCSTGHFLVHLKDKIARGVGVDFDKHALEFCKEKTGFQTISGGLDAAVETLQNETFDVVCCFQVLEHVSDLDAFLKGIRRLVKPNGTVYIEVPNLKDPLLSLYNIPTYKTFFYHEDHIHYFSKKSLQLLLTRFGFEGNYLCYQDYNLMNHARWLTTQTPQASCIGGLGSPVLPYQKPDEKEAKLVDAFFQSINTDYLNLLSRLGYTDNLAFIGTVTK